MKKFIFALALVLLLTGVASAHDVWQVDSFGNFVLDSFGNKIAVIHNHPTNANPLDAVQIGMKGYTGHQIVKNGWTLKAGQEDCPAWYIDRGQGACWKVPASAPALELPAWYIAFLRRM